jgi:hypothetical protein
VKAIVAACAILTLAACAGIVLTEAGRGAPPAASRDAAPAATPSAATPTESPDDPPASATSSTSRSAPRDALPRALALISFDPASLGHRIEVAPARPDVRAELDRRTETITLYARAGDPPHRWAHDLAHEFGHAFDDLRLTDSGRRAYLTRRGVPGATWAAAPGASDYATGAGDFAEVFALCHAASPDFRSRLASRPEDPCTVLPSAALRLPAPTPASMPPTTASP